MKKDIHYDHVVFNEFVCFWTMDIIKHVKKTEPTSLDVREFVWSKNWGGSRYSDHIKNLNIETLSNALTEKAIIRVNNAKIEYPIVSLKLNQGYVALDGLHRIVKTVLDGECLIKSYVISSLDLMSIPMYTIDEINTARYRSIFDAQEYFDYEL